MLVIGRNISELLYNCSIIIELLITIISTIFSTGVLFLPWGYDLAMWSSTLVYLVTFAYGDVWKIPLFGTELNSGHFLEYVLHISASTNLPMVFYNIYRSYADKTGKMRSFSECIRPLIPLVAFLGITTFWVKYSPNNIVEKDPRAVYLLVGTIFSNISCRLIVSQMSNTRCEVYNSQILYLGICFMSSMIFPFFERTLLYLMLIFSTFAHWQYGSVVVQQLCMHFNRICFGVTLSNSVKDVKKN
jgi:ethanolaminephosphotransferase